MGIARNIARLVPNGSGLLPNANIEAVAASKLTGQVPDANAPSGSVVQIVTGTYDSTYSSDSTSFADLISLSITPISSSNKILILVNIYAAGYGSPKLLRNSTAIVSPNVNYALYFASPNGSQPYQSGYRVMYPFQVYDSPATTSAITYKLQIQGHNPGSAIVVNPDTSNNYSTTSPAQSLTRMTLMEIVG